MAYIQGESRSETSIFPVSLEELIPEDHLVRVIDLYVARLDLGQLGFEKAPPKATGRPSDVPLLPQARALSAIAVYLASMRRSTPSR